MLDVEVVIALMKEGVSTSETLVHLYNTTQLNIPEDSHHLSMFNPNIINLPNKNITNTKLTNSVMQKIQKNTRVLQ
jgi:hypothetical protein